MVVEKQRMVTFLCPKCNARQKQPSFVKQVSHVCPMAKVGNKIVEMKLVG